MKIKILLFSILIIISQSFSVQAQIEKGSKMVGGYGYVLLKDPFNLNISPNIGFFLNDRIAVGSSVIMSFYGSEDYTQFNLGVLPFTRYYFGRGDTRLFALASLGYRREWERYKEGASTRKLSYGNVQGDLGIGLTHLITDQIGLEAILNFTGINIGFQIYVPSGK